MHLQQHHCPTCIGILVPAPSLSTVKEEKSAFSSPTMPASCFLTRVWLHIIRKLCGGAHQATTSEWHFDINRDKMVADATSMTSDSFLDSQVWDIHEYNS